MLIVAYNKRDIKTIIKRDLFNYISSRVFFHLGDNKLLYLIVLFSKNLNPTKYNYEIYNQKLLAIIKYFE